MELKKLCGIGVVYDIDPDTYNGTVLIEDKYIYIGVDHWNSMLEATESLWRKIPYEVSRPVAIKALEKFANRVAHIWGPGYYDRVCAFEALRLMLKGIICP